MGGNIYAFGDIHGEVFKLKALLNRLYINEDDTLVFLGDYIDRGTHSFEVVEHLIEISKMYNCVFLKGNHEAMFMDYLMGRDEDLFIYNGGKKTLSSYKRNGWDVRAHMVYTSRRLPVSHVKFLQGLKLYHETDDFIFVHAGIHPEVELAKSPEEILLWSRDFVYYHMMYKGKPVVFGHSPAKEVLNSEYKICVDTGACFESMGNLTCVKLPERVFINQGPVVEDL